MGLPYIVAGIGIGVYIKGGTLKESAFWGLTTYAIAQTVVHPISSTTMIARGAQYGFTTSLQQMSVDALGSSVARGGAAIALAAVSGAVVGTAVSQAIWGEEGARQALTFYGFDAGAGKANYWEKDGVPGYFNIPGNVSKIWKHYIS